MTDPVIEATDSAPGGDGPSPASDAARHPGALLQVRDVSKVYGTGHTWVAVSLKRSYSLKTQPQYCW